MLIPENGKWRWNDGPLCDTKEEALASAKPATVSDSAPVMFYDTAEIVELEDAENNH
jgi:hypothetical protein